MGEEYTTKSVCATTLCKKIVQCLFALKRVINQQYCDYSHTHAHAHGYAISSHDLFRGKRILHTSLVLSPSQYC